MMSPATKAQSHIEAVFSETASAATHHRNQLPDKPYQQNPTCLGLGISIRDRYSVSLPIELNASETVSPENHPCIVW